MSDNPKYEMALNDELREDMRQQLLQSFEAMVYLADDRADTCKNDSNAAINAANIAKTLINRDLLSPREQKSLADGLKACFDLHSKRARSKDNISSGAAVNALFDALCALNDYAEQKNRFGTFKPIK
ncbi:MAG: hypothetical protein NZ828_03625 [Alphaproteobacteria bacterium]|nr:hypothetical protein [Alphaproteobacteria bacterium]